MGWFSKKTEVAEESIFSGGPYHGSVIETQDSDIEAAEEQQDDCDACGIASSMIVNNWCSEDTNSCEAKVQPDVQAFRLKVLELAFSVEQSRAQQKVVYIDTGNMVKAKADAYVKAVSAGFKAQDGADLFMPRREGSHNTEVVIVPGTVSVEDVIRAADELMLFINAPTV